MPLNHICYVGIAEERPDLSGALPGNPEAEFANEFGRSMDEIYEIAGSLGNRLLY